MGMIELPGFFRGDDHTIRLRLKYKATGTPVDITGWTITSTIKLSSEQPDSEGIQSVYKAEAGNPDNSLGIAYLVFTHDMTEKLLTTSYQIDFQREKDGLIKTLFTARISVIPDVTRGQA